MLLTFYRKLSHLISLFMHKTTLSIETNPEFLAYVHIAHLIR